MAELVRLGVIGCGRRSGAYLNGLKELWDHGLQGFRVVALSGPGEPEAHGLRAEQTPRESVEALPRPHLCVSDLHPEPPALYECGEAMLADEHLALDAVLLLTPAASHHELCAVALGRGVHVLVDSPLAVSLAAGRRMAEQAAGAGLSLMVAQPIRYREANRMAAWCLQQGALGELRLALEVSLALPGEPTPELMMGWGLERLSLLEALCGPIASVGAISRRLAEGSGPDDSFLAQLVFEGGAIGQLGCSFGAGGQPTQAPLTVYGRLGSLSTGVLLTAEGEELVSQRFARLAPEAEARRLLPEHLHCPFARLLLEFLEAVRAGRRLTPDFRDLALAYALIESAGRGSAVAVTDILSGAVRDCQAAIDARYALV